MNIFDIKRLWLRRLAILAFIIIMGIAAIVVGIAAMLWEAAKGAALGISYVAVEAVALVQDIKLDVRRAWRRD